MMVLVNLDVQIWDSFMMRTVVLGIRIEPIT